MNAKQIGLSLVLADYLAVVAYAMYQYGHLGVVGFSEMVLGNAVGVATVADLAIALTLGTIWMWGDARRRGLAPAPYAVLTLLLGSAGLLAYLVRVTGDVPAPALAARAARA